MENPKFREISLEYDECIVGQSINCLAYAYMNNLPVFGLEKYKPLEFNYIPDDIDLSPLMISNELKTFKMLDNRSCTFGMDRIKLWHILSSQLSYCGLMPGFGMYDALNIIDNNNFTFIANGKKVKVQSECVLYFDIMDNVLYEVNDYLDITRNSNIPIDYYESTSQDWPFYRELYFYDSRRVSGRHKNKKDVCAKSILTKDQLDDFDYSEVNIKFKIEDFLKNNLNKSVNIKLNRREIRPLFESVYRIEQIMNLDVKMDEMKKMLYKHYICSPCDIK
tara:strand:+ start:6763 stop:7596 length:834 start_codon:yes stop_codon:yes gene_type:complete